MLVPTVTEYLPRKTGLQRDGKPVPYGHRITAVKGRRGDSRIARATEYAPPKIGVPRVDVGIRPYTLRISAANL